MEDDNPRQFDRVKHRAVNVKNANFDWTRIAMSLKSPTFSRRFRTKDRTYSYLSVGVGRCTDDV